MISSIHVNLLFFLQHLLRVVPVIGIMNERNAFSPRPNPAEVDEVFDAPLDMFIKVIIFVWWRIKNMTIFYNCS